MGKKTRPGKRGGTKKQRPRHLRPVPSAPRESSRAEDQPLIASIRGALRSEEPLDLLIAVSGLLEVTDARRDLLGRGDVAEQRETLIESFLEISFAETTAALMVIREFLPDEVLGARITRELASRRQPMPDWLRHLGDVRVTSGVSLVTHELGDGDDYMFTVALSSGHEISVVAFLDHNMGSALKDGFVVPSGHEELLDHIRSSAPRTQSAPTIEAVDPVTARAIIERAGEDGRRVFPPPESDSWPMCRPLVEWLVRLLPPGGVVPEAREWSAEDLDELTEVFFASPYGRDIDTPEARDAVEAFLWLVEADPLRWSPVVVEILLLDRIPRKVRFDPQEMAGYPDVMRAFVRFAHAEQEVTAASTAETLRAIDEYEPDYLREIRRSDRPSSADMLAHALGSALTGADEPSALGSAEIALSRLDRMVGGRPALLALDDRPLPDEEFETAGIAPDIVDAVADIGALCDAAADEFFDVEHRTAMRRLLSRVARNDPAVFRRRASVARSAASAGWIIGRANHTLNGEFATMTVGDFVSWFGVSGSVSQRAGALLAAIGVHPAGSAAIELGTADLLTSQMRRDIIERRDRALSQV
ncbi:MULTISPECIES: hypothetical protein [Gordonia]|jgi:hypothetical protein|uniref:hypothetical protein n=1 Tax=Gordonia TaxID=2053 RepID=UPI0032B4603D